MKHAGTDALDRLNPLLIELREIGLLKERSRGVFYYRSKAFLHFHEDPTGLFADIRFDSSFTRLPVDSPEQSSRLVDLVRFYLKCEL